MNSLKTIQEIMVKPRQLKTSWAQFIDWIWSFPSTGDPKLRGFLRCFLRVQLIFCREFGRDRIPLRASALTFTIILSLVPTLAFCTAVLKGMGAGDQARQAAHRLIDQLEYQDTGKTLPGMGGGVAPGVPAENDQPSSLTGQLRKATDHLFDYIERTDFTALGAFGIAGLILAVMSVLHSIETSINAIWLAESARPLGRKVMDYLALIILLPLTINLAFATEATIHSPVLLDMVQRLLPMAGITHFLFKMLPVLLVIGTFSVLYRFLPNTRVKMFPAVIGGIFAGSVWFIIQVLYIRLQIDIASYNAIYGSFAFLPLFLIWLLLGWIIFLSGAEMAFALQHWRNYDPKNKMLTPIARLALAFNITEAVYAAFRQREVTDRAGLAEKLNLPEIALQGILQDLLNAGIIRRVSDDADGYVPASPAGSVAPMEIVDLIFGTEVPPFRGSSLAIEALNAARQALNGRKIGISQDK